MHQSFLTKPALSQSTSAGFRAPPLRRELKRQRNGVTMRRRVPFSSTGPTKKTSNFGRMIDVSLTCRVIAFRSFTWKPSTRSVTVSLTNQITVMFWILRPPRGTLRFDHSDPRLGPSRHICHRYRTRLKQFWVCSLKLTARLLRKNQCS